MIPPAVDLTMIRFLLSCVCCSVLLTAMSGCGTAKVPENVVLIVVDTLRADHLGMYGYERPTTPLLDGWASRGLVFEQAIAPSPWTLPTFGSLLTGLTPPVHGAGSRVEGGTRRWRRAPLNDSVVTLPERFLAEGFRTGAIVNNPFLRPHFGAARGFEDYDYEKGRRADAAVNRAQLWINDNANQRFFLMLHLIDPHLPYGPPPSTRGRFADSAAPDFVPRGRKNLVSMLDEMDDTDRENIVARYDEEIAFVDQELDRLFRFLEGRGLWDSTLVVLTADHGEELFDRGGFEHGHSMFQELLRVPLIVWGPGVRSGRESSPISLIDLKPTLLEAVEGEPTQGVEGRSVWRSIQSGRPAQEREILAANTLWGREKQSLLAWPYKLILDPMTGSTELYDLVEDPRERRNLVSEKSALAVALEERLRSSMRNAESSAPKLEVSLSDEMEDELRALGYLD